MQMFTVPQFIDVEDKIIGPITSRQFIICLVGLGILVPAWKLLDLIWFIGLAIIDLIIILAFAFVKINGRPFHYFVLNVIQTFKKPNLRVWNHKNSLKDFLSAEESSTEEVQTVTKKEPSRGPMAGSRLKELSLIVDTKGVYKGDDEEEGIV